MVIGRGTLLVGLGVVIVDQAAKHIATAILSQNSGGDPSTFNGWLSLTYITNQGAAFGALAGSGALFILIAAAVVGMILASAFWFRAFRPVMTVSLGLQLGGATGNLVDRVRLGYVVDFIHVKHWPVFNLADAAIVSGALVLVWFWVTSPNTQSQDTRNTSPNSGMEIRE
ncbi:MAG: signal peptidase [Chloroflexi bacterium]|nr:signal peptidase [Chloroflexota bacterium]